MARRHRSSRFGLGKLVGGGVILGFIFWILSKIFGFGDDEEWEGGDDYQR